MKSRDNRQKPQGGANPAGRNKQAAGGPGDKPAPSKKRRKPAGQSARDERRRQGGMRGIGQTAEEKTPNSVPRPDYSGAPNQENTTAPVRRRTGDSKRKTRAGEGDQAHPPREERRPPTRSTNPREKRGNRPAREPLVAVEAPVEGPLLFMTKDPIIEQRIHGWLDVLIYVWRKRTQPGKARFIRGAYLTEEETARIGKAVQQLSRGFTGHRQLVGKTYLEDADLLGAYLLFYWPVSYAQAWTVIQDQRRIYGEFDLKRIADVGSGPGPLTCALIDAAFEAGQTPEAIAIDHSAEALALLSEICSAAYGVEFIEKNRLKTKVWDATGDSAKLPVGGSFDCISFGHVLNEMWVGVPPQVAVRKRAEFLTKWAGMLRKPAKTPAETAKSQPDQQFDEWKAGTVRTEEKAIPRMPPALLILEPALKPTTRSLLEVRDQLVAAGSTILGPCFFQGKCPALETADATCHGQVFWEVPGTLRRLANVARVSKEEIAMAWLVVGATEKPSISEKNWRVVGEAMLNKAGRTRYMICGAPGRTSLSIKRGEVVETAAEADRGARTRAQRLEEAFFALRRGDAVRMEGAAERESGWGVTKGMKLDLL